MEGRHRGNDISIFIPGKFFFAVQGAIRISRRTADRFRFRIGRHTGLVRRWKKERENKDLESGTGLIVAGRPDQRQNCISHHVYLRASHHFV